MMMRSSLLRIFVLASLAASGIGSEDEAPYFSLSSNRTFGSNGKPSIELSAWNIDALEFRVYRINDPVKFFAQLQDSHTFGGGARKPSRQRTFLERLHDWKRELRAGLRRSIRAQFTESPSAHFAKALPASAPQPMPRGTHFAEAPLLNPQQLVLTFKQPVHSTSRWDTQKVDIGVEQKGLYLVEAVKGELRAYTIVMVSDLVMITKTVPGRTLAFVADRATGKPAAGAEVSFLKRDGEPSKVRANADGLAEIQTAKTEADELRIVARFGADVAAVTPYIYGTGRGDWIGYIYTDRPIYRPGHTVHFKAILRLRTAAGYDLPPAKPIDVRIQSPDGKPVYQKALTISANGSVQDDFELPAGSAIGDYYINVGGPEDDMTGSFAVEEYKKPEYEVRVTPAKAHVLQGEPIDAVIEARYFFGEPVAGAKVKYTVYRSRYWAPYWFDSEDDAGDEPDSYEGYGGDQIDQSEGQLDQDGKLTVHIKTSTSDKHRDYRYRIEAGVTDDAKREILGAGSVIVSYASFMVNVAPERYVYSAGDTGVFKVAARDYENRPVRAQLHLELMKWKKGERTGIASGATDVTTGEDGTALARIPIPADGTWFHVTATAKTPEGREASDSASVWVSSGRWAAWDEEEHAPVKIIADKSRYQPGDTAKLLIVTGAPETSVLVCVEAGTLRSARVLKSKETSLLFELPIGVQDEPGLYVTAQFVRNGEVHQGMKHVKVPPEDHKLNLKITTDKPQYAPGDTATYNILATDAKGAPVARANLSLGVVDEAIYGLRQDGAANLLKFFYGRAVNRVNTQDSLRFYFTGEAGKRRMRLAGLRSPSKLAQLKPDQLVRPKVRKLFPDTAFWAADLTTDAAGVATARIPFPDSITTWRATVRGIGKDKAGNTILKTIVRKNLILRLAAPRFLIEGDEIVVSAIAHNYLTRAKKTRFTLDVTGLDILDGKTQDIEIPSRGEAKVDWRLRAKPGRTATLTGQALTDEESDALELSLPVNPQGVKMAVVSGGVAAAGATADLRLPFPDRVQPGSRSLSIRIAPSIAGSLFGALEYLTTFPYGCVEQTMSSFLPNIIVKHSVTELGLKPKMDEVVLAEKIRAGLERLYRFQHEDGGWGWWETDDSHPFMTAYVVAGLVDAQAAGTDVKREAIQKGAAWLNKHAGRNSRVAPDLRAYIAWALTLAEDAEAAARRQEVYGDNARLSPYGVALLGLAMERAKDARAGQLAARLEGAAQQDDQQAWWPALRDDMLDFNADVTPEATAYAIKFLSHQKPSSALLPKGAAWLMNHRSEGYWWSSTKQTAMVIYGLTDYVKATNELKPGLTATVYVNNRQVLTQKFDEATLLNGTELKLDDGKLEAGANAIRVATSGTGRIYYSARAEYFSTEEKMQKTGSASLNILRDYFRLVPVKAGDKTVYDLAPLNGPVASGDVLAVRLTVTGTEWKYLLIEDPIPAGAEFVQHDEKFELKERPRWWGTWFTRREMHDDRMAIFQTYFNPGQHFFFYVLKVVNPGVFQMNPARVEPMYQPGFLSTTENRRLEVK